jgi:hypothetical protein
MGLILLIEDFFLFLAQFALVTEEDSIKFEEPLALNRPLMGKRLKPQTSGWG